jgi:predicted DNA-binding transcriptional regulator YafY
MEPHALLINWPAWYLLAFDHLRGQPRTFRLDRFLHVEVEAAMFRPRPLDVSRDLLAGTGVPLRGV